ncbi:MAG: phenylalanine--tRNA ligase subunit beta, partial [Desulfatitalea sp.]|nr:phenylalanine--tRNA ligase subunit beta [Desulfatitalea sp.]NNK01341.1 phenylalanine--tRNA ligase subunit beta [Desulfatitalea sp.]
LVTGITVGPSPFWLKERLSAVGLRPINNIVDVTNFVMLETGQPLHAFDFDRLAGRRIVVRTAADGELFTTLDGKERRLEPDMLMICDGEKPVAVGGVMGGLNSEIEDGTACVLIESAYFTPISIRRTAKRLGLKSDASHRFERGVDPRGTLYALDRAAQLITQLGGGKLIDGTIDVADDLPVAPTIELSVAATNRLLGTDVERDDIARLLSEIDFQVSTMNDDVLQVTVPSFRVDVSRPEDLMEEVARRIGYDQIPVTFPVIPAEAHPSAEAFLQRQEIRELLVGMGFAEAITYSFVPADAARRLGFGEQDPRSRQLAILNPLSEDQAVMRTSLVHGLLDTMHHNLAHQSRNLRLFEIGNIFISRGSDQQPEEIEMLAGLWTGDGNHAQWHTKARPCDFYDMKGTVEGLLKGLRVRDACITAQADEQCIYTAPGATALIMVDGEPLGIVGQMHPKVLAAYDLRQAAFVFELDVARLVARIPQRLKFRPLPKYPATTRDTTLIVARDLEADALVDFVRKADVPLVEEAHLFDVFEGGAMAPDQKSVSLRIVYRSVDTTLEDAAVNDLHKQLSERLVAHFKADLPA